MNSNILRSTNMHFHMRLVKYGDAEYSMEGSSGYCDGIVFKCNRQDCDERMLPMDETIVLEKNVAAAIVDEWRARLYQKASEAHKNGYDHGYKDGYEDGVDD